jgi:hypothetical protein
VPRDAAVLLIDYGSTTGLAPHPRDFTLTELRRASAERRQEALSILDSLEG